MNCKKKHGNYRLCLKTLGFLTYYLVLFDMYYKRHIQFINDIGCFFILFGILTSECVSCVMSYSYLPVRDTKWVESRYFHTDAIPEFGRLLFWQSCLEEDVSLSLISVNENSS